MFRSAHQFCTFLICAAMLAAGWGSAAPAQTAESEPAPSHEHDGDAGQEHVHADESAADHAGHEAADHDAGDHGGIDYNKPPLDLDPRLLVWSLVVFLTFLWVAKRLAWLPMISGLDARESRVNRALAEAEAARREATRLLADHKKHLDSVTEEVKAIIAKSRGEAEQEKNRIIAEAEAEAMSLRDGAIADIHAAREQALAGLDERIEGQVDVATRHVLG